MAEIGRGEKIRTSDPHNPIVVRYQAALRPDRLQDSRPYDFTPDPVDWIDC